MHETLVIKCMYFNDDNYDIAIITLASPVKLGQCGTNNQFEFGN